MVFGDFIIKSKADLRAAIREFGFLPFFENSIGGFSIEEHIAPQCWWNSETGAWSAWEWKGPVIRETGCAYYDFDARYDDGLAPYRDKRLYDLIEGNAPILSKQLKQLGNYKKGGNKGFDTSVTRLQAQGYVLISDFVYSRDKSGKTYGWGVAEYSTPEVFMGSDFSDRVYSCSPEESCEKIATHLGRLFPQLSADKIKKFIK